MSKPKPADPDVLMAYLLRLNEHIRDQAADTAKLLAERADVIRQLIDAGVQQATIARAIGVTKAAIAQTLAAKRAEGERASV